METVKKRLKSTTDRLDKLNDRAMVDLAGGVAGFMVKLKSRLRGVTRMRWLLRLTLATGLASGCYSGWSYVKVDSGLALDVSSWNEIVSVASNSLEVCVLAVPLFLSIFFVERYVERALLLSMLSYLEQLNDSIYDQQFDDNPFELMGDTVAGCNDWLLEYLDCCTALLLIVRMLAQLIARQSTDKIVLDRCGIVRRGAGDNHTRILMKIGILRAAVSTINENSSDKAIFGDRKVSGFAAGMIQS